MTYKGGVGGHRMRAAANSDFQLEVGKGNIEGYSPIFFSGENFNIGASEVTLWGKETLYAFPSSAAQISVVSTSANDTLAGTGARQVVVIGLDASHNPLVEIIDMDGVSQNSSASSFFRVSSFSVFTHGSLNSNAGDIEVLHGANSVAFMVAGEGQSRECVGTVPAGKTWFAQGLSVLVGRADEVDVRAVAFTPSGLRVDFSRNIMYQDYFGFENFNMVPFPEKFDVMVTGASTSGSTGKASCVVQFLEVDNEDF